MENLALNLIQESYYEELPLPPKTSKRFSTIVAVWPHLGGGDAPETDSSVHSSETVSKKYKSMKKIKDVKLMRSLWKELKQLKLLQIPGKEITCVQNEDI